MMAPDGRAYEIEQFPCHNAGEERTLFLIARGREGAGRCIALRPLSSNEAEEKTMAEFTLKIDGMHCGGCVRRVSQTLGAMEGVTVNEVRVGTAKVDAASQDAVDRAIAALNEDGYKAQLES
jgi:copper chaperone